MTNWRDGIKNEPSPNGRDDEYIFSSSTNIQEKQSWATLAVSDVY